MLLAPSAQGREIKLSEDNVNFNFTENGRLSEQRQLVMENKFSFPIAVDWTLLPVLNKTTNQFVKNPFKVSPQRQEIEANGSYTFNVEFLPYEASSYFF